MQCNMRTGVIGWWNSLPRRSSFNGSPEGQLRSTGEPPDVALCAVALRAKATANVCEHRRVWASPNVLFLGSRSVHWLQHRKEINTSLTLPGAGSARWTSSLFVSLHVRPHASISKPLFSFFMWSPGGSRILPIWKFGSGHRLHISAKATKSSKFVKPREFLGHSRHIKRHIKCTHKTSPPLGGCVAATVLSIFLRLFPMHTRTKLHEANIRQCGCKYVFILPWLPRISSPKIALQPIVVIDP